MHSRKLKIAASLLVIAVILNPFPGLSSTFVALSLHDLALKATHICIGEVLDSKGEMENGHIYTVHRVKIVRPVFASTKSPLVMDAGAIIDVVTAGGEFGNLGQKVYGAADLQKGEQYLLFLSLHDSVLRPVGMFQGVYPIVKDQYDKVQRVYPSRVSSRLVEHPSRTQGRLVNKQRWLRNPAALSNIIRDIESIVESDK